MRVTDISSGVTSSISAAPAESPAGSAGRAAITARNPDAQKTRHAPAQPGAGSDAIPAGRHGDRPGLAPCIVSNIDDELGIAPHSEIGTSVHCRAIAIASPPSRNPYAPIMTGGPHQITIRPDARIIPFGYMRHIMGAVSRCQCAEDASHVYRIRPSPRHQLAGPG
ncbi:hypothetical protein [Dyella lutea]|uniref:Uncharacterized protein n=1 Tax=Dyella lutea TaxID=2950441 RepID=A0ABT1FEG6_9GAMM|nr:hypothetical protein [Dyella lutea]MCP1374478.1 hypothetical protein [Dyella lutea]